MAYAQPGYARAAGAQSSGRVCPPEPSPHPESKTSDRTVQICDHNDNVFDARRKPAATAVGCRNQLGGANAAGPPALAGAL